MPNDNDSKPQKLAANGIIRPANPAAISEAGALIRAGEIVAFPTETVYGLGGDATNSLAVAKIFAAKGRPSFNPLIVHVPDLASAEVLGHFTPLAKRLAAQFWPGPLTLVVRRRPNSGIAELVSAGLPTLAIRVPGNTIARDLLRAAARPLAAPSANRSGYVSATCAGHVAADIGREIAMILDGGATLHGLESTIIEAMGDGLTLLRSGAVAVQDLEAMAGVRIQRATGTHATPSAPGQLASHYAPRAAIRLNAETARAGDALLGFGPDMPRFVGPQFNLSPSGNLTEAAANLFAALRTLDASGAATIAVMPIPDHGLGEAINDRLRRAAAPRP